MLKQYWQNTKEVDHFPKRKQLLYTTSALLLLGVFTLPSEYYIFLRWAVSITAAYMVYRDFQDKNNSWVLTFGIIFLLFNPVIPVYLHDKTGWVFIDIVAAGVFIFRAVKINLLEKKL